MLKNDSILNDFFKAINKLLAKALAALITICWKVKHYLKKFRYIRIIIIQKPNKALYKKSEA